MITHGIQCDCKNGEGDSIDGKIREIQYSGESSILDFLVEFDTIEYAIELKVDVNGQFGGEFSTFAAALTSEANKLTTWRSTEGRNVARWVVGIMDASMKRCGEIATLFARDFQDICRHSSTVHGEMVAMRRILMHGTFRRPQSYRTATIWTETTVNGLLYVLVCLETTRGDGIDVCKKPNFQPLVEEEAQQTQSNVRRSTRKTRKQTHWEDLWQEIDSMQVMEIDPFSTQQSMQIDE